MNYAILIETSTEDSALDNKFSKVSFEGNIKLKDMYRLIGCRLIDIKETNGLVCSGVGIIRPLSMVFDDEFLLNGNKQPNIAASLLYGWLQHGEMIHGNVLLCDTDADGNSIGFSEQETDNLIKNLEKLLALVGKN